MKKQSNKESSKTIAPLKGEASRTTCRPTCPLFRCSKNALVVVTRFYRGKPRKVILCRWVGDLCVGAKCQYAYCVKRAMLPDGTCGLGLREQRVKDLLKEIEEEEFGRDVKSILTKRFGKRDMLLE